MLDASLAIAVLRHLCALAMLAWLWRLLSTRTAANYPWLAVWLAFSFGRYAVMTILPGALTIWAVGEIVHAALLALVIWELLAITESRYPHESRGCQKVLAACVLIALAICWWSGDITLARGPVILAGSLRRALSTAYLLTLGIGVVFFEFVPVPIPRNLHVHRWLLVAYTTTYSATYCTMYLAPSTRKAASIILMSAVTAIYVAYSLLWRAVGETMVSGKAGHPDVLFEEEKAVAIRDGIRRALKTGVTHTRETGARTAT